MVARTPAWIRYNIRVVWLSLIYSAFLIFAVYGFKHGMFGGPASYLVAILPALPTGRQWMSGASPRASTTSKAAVFCPSIRAGLTELTRSTG